MTTPQLRDALYKLREQSVAIRQSASASGLDSVKLHRLTSALDRIHHDTLRAVSILDGRSFPVLFPDASQDKP